MRFSSHREFHRNGQLRQEVSLRRGARHGVLRTWHPNGVLASEEPYENDLIHGVCRQWDESGRLLGEDRMVRGTGRRREWHDNGRVRSEITMVDGAFCGLSRRWLRDGTLMAQRCFVDAREVSPARYRQLAEHDARLPRWRGRLGRPLAKGPELERRLHRSFVATLLAKAGRVPARTWLASGNGSEVTPGTGPATGRRPAPGRGRFLGRIRRIQEAVRLVDDLFSSGARDVLAAGVSGDGSGNEYADWLVVRLPKERRQRIVIWKAAAVMMRRRWGTLAPERDLGGRHLVLVFT